jgi:hypothetical protein
MSFNRCDLNWKSEHTPHIPHVSASGAFSIVHISHDHVLLLPLATVVIGFVYATVVLLLLLLTVGVGDVAVVGDDPRALPPIPVPSNDGPFFSAIYQMEQH